MHWRRSPTWLLVTSVTLVLILICRYVRLKFDRGERASCYFRRSVRGKPLLGPSRLPLNLLRSPVVRTAEEPELRGPSGDVSPVVPTVRSWEPRGA